jgi:predicted 2-oxoglutarate/Fe(II)-dependent dioxygenase YbiX
MSFFSYFTPTKKSETAVTEKSIRLTGLSTAEFDPKQCIVNSLPLEVRTWKNKTNPQFAVVIDNVLSPEECHQWVQDTEVKGYEVAMVNIGGGKQKVITEVRNSSRCIIDDEERVAELWSRIESFIPKDLFSKKHLIPVGLNERLRFLRYHPGEYFAPHCDGSFVYPADHPTKAGQVSELTFILYLNDGYEGGSTRFFTDWNEKNHFDVVPKKGSVLIFEHPMYHEGVTLVEGVKYCVRTDVMYQNNDYRLGKTTPQQQKQHPEL